MVIDILDFNIKTKDAKGYYAKAKNNINAIFQKVATCEDVIAIYGVKISADVENLELKKTALTILEKLKCTASNEFGQWAKDVCAVEPSQQCAINIVPINLQKNI